ncbi:MAG: hypothetical protein DCC43_15955 [Candidatus Brocadia sp.]|nr:hypothetical protein [Anaerolineales bacterium]MCE7913013.1 hypothetical protein [Candidatus Brocadia sp. AMX3]RIJ88610.1 MAG: hypothetical protein DCC43_15955 [Candidatus Brocadia sp.]
MNIIKRVLDEYLRYGEFPEIAFVTEKEPAREIHAMYARNILYQGIAARFKVKKAGDIDNLFVYPLTVSLI